MSVATVHHIPSTVVVTAIYNLRSRLLSGSQTLTKFLLRLNTAYTQIDLYTSTHGKSHNNNDCRVISCTADAATIATTVYAEPAYVTDTSSIRSHRPELSLRKPLRVMEHNLYSLDTTSLNQ